MRFWMAMSLVVTVSWLAAACASSAPATASEQGRVQAEPRAATELGPKVTPFVGKTFKMKESVKLDEFEYGLMVDGNRSPRLLIKLVKIHEQEYQEPGRKAVITTQAELAVRLGPDDASPKRVVIDEQDSKWASGCKLSIGKARGEYIERRQKWLPRAMLSVISCRP